MERGKKFDLIGKKNLGKVEKENVAVGWAKKCRLLQKRTET